MSFINHNNTYIFSSSINPKASLNSKLEKVNSSIPNTIFLTSLLTKPNTFHTSSSIFSQNIFNIINLVN